MERGWIVETPEVLEVSPPLETTPVEPGIEEVVEPPIPPATKAPDRIVTSDGEGANLDFEKPRKPPEEPIVQTETPPSSISSLPPSTEREANPPTRNANDVQPLSTRQEKRIADNVTNGRDPLTPDPKIQKELEAFIEQHFERLRSGQRKEFVNDFWYVPDSDLITAQLLTKAQASEFFYNLTIEERRNFPFPSNIEILQTNFLKPTFSVMLQYGEPKITPSGKAWDDASHLLIALRDGHFRVYGGNYGKLHRKDR